MAGDTGAVRPGEELDVNALAAYLRWHLSDEQLPGLRLSDELQIAQFAGGHSNLTYLLRLGGAELVLRRPPIGPVPPRAHDMAREFKWLAALHPLFPLAPRPYLLCDDASVLGCVFYVMERRRGIVIRHDEPLPVAGHPELRRQISASMVDTLVDLHRLDVTREPLADLGKPAGFVARQVRGWRERWEQSRLSPIAVVDDTAEWLATHVPADSPEPTVVHGDFKLDNALLNPLNPSELVAVLDWEMCALGDPLVDVGILLAYWTWAAVLNGTGTLSIVTDRAGYLSRDEVIERYAAGSGRDVSQITFYEIFAVFKLIVVVQQIYARYHRGQTTDPRFASMGEAVDRLSGALRVLVERHA